VRIYFRNRRRLEADHSEEGFTNINAAYSSKSISDRKSVAFDTNYYLKNDNETVLTKKTLNIVPFRCNTYTNPDIQYDSKNKEINVSTPITYLDKVVNYMRWKVYPLEGLETPSSIDTIHRLINGELDIGFINEEVLLRYYNKDCRYLTSYLDSTYGVYDTVLEKKKYKYKDLNFSVVSSTFYQDMYLFVSADSNITTFENFAKPQGDTTAVGPTIGVLKDSIYYLQKLIHSYINYAQTKLKDEKQINIDSSYDNIDILLQKFKDGDIAGFFIVSHPKNSKLLELTKNIEVRLIHLQPREHGISSGGESAQDYDSTQVYDSAKERQDDQEDRLEAITNAAKISDESQKKTFNIIIRKVFKTIIPRSINLNSFYTTGNSYSYLDTYSLKQVLVMRNDINIKYGKMFIDYYFNNIDNIKNDINVDFHNVDIENYNIIDFDYKDSISFYRYNFPMHPLVKEKYKECGFIKTVKSTKCKLEDD